MRIPFQASKDERRLALFSEAFDNWVYRFAAHIRITSPL